MKQSTVSMAMIALCVFITAPIEAKEPAPAGDLQCADVSASIRMEAYGYTHVVTLTNGCSKPVVCEVWTDVDPTPHLTLQAAPGESASVITRRGSPSSVVQAGRSCHFN